MANKSSEPYASQEFLNVMQKQLADLTATVNQLVQGLHINKRVEYIDGDNNAEYHQPNSREGERGGERGVGHAGALEQYGAYGQRHESDYKTKKMHNFSNIAVEM